MKWYDWDIIKTIVVVSVHYVHAKDK